MKLKEFYGEHVYTHHLDSTTKTLLQLFYPDLLIYGHLYPPSNPSSSMYF